jgi:hypothetical protein
VRRFRLAVVAAVFAFLLAQVGTGSALTASELFVSEYIEGSSNNKALEIFNGTGADVNLAADGYDVQMFFNGSTTAGLTIGLTGTVADGDVYVVAQAAAGSAILAQADQTSGAGWFNGDDAVVLRKGGTVIDAIGQVGLDPGAEWGTGLTSTADNTLRRKATITAGDTNGSDAFDPSVEWDGFATDTFGALGCHPDAPCPEPPPPPSGCDVATTHELAQVQGAGAATPLANQDVRVEGVVTGDFQGAGELGGFFLQDDTPDADAATSDGLFAFSSTAVAVGDRVRVSGRAIEFNGLTELSPVTAVDVCGTGTIAAQSYDLPRPVGVTFEPVEGVLLTFPEALTATEHFQLGRFGEVTVSSDGRLFQPTERNEPGAAAVAAADEAARRRLLIDDGSNVQNPATIPFLAPDVLRIGDTATGITGVLSFGFSLYRLEPTAGITFSRTNPRPGGREDVGGDIQVASFNTLNYFTTLGSENPNARGADTAEEFARQQAKEVAAITGLDADVIGLMEVENNGGTAIGSLADALNAATAPGTYAAITEPVLNAPNEFGGQFGTDAIKVALLYRPASVVPVGAAQSSANAIFDRPPLIQTFERVGGSERFTAVVNHFKSKNCSDATGLDLDQGDGQSCFNARRVAQATALAGVLDTLDVPNPLIVGDLNAYSREDPIDTLEAAGYTGLSETYVPDDDRYSFVFDGFSGELDHALASASLLDNVTGATIWHVNADEPLILDYNTEFNPPALYQPDAFRSSDHDPLILGLDLCETTPPTLSVTVSPSTLRPPNHKYRTVRVTFTAADNSGLAPDVTLVSVTSNEPDDAPGGADGNTTNDIVITDQTTFELRAERSENGNGRVYTITYRATDACGNATTKSATVTVPVA